MYVVSASGRGAIYHVFDDINYAFTRTENHPTLCGRRLPAAVGKKGWTLTSNRPTGDGRMCDDCYRVIVEDRGPD
jgi:hypothetical protein